MDNKKLKILSGIIWTTVFLSVIFVVASIYTPNKISLRNLAGTVVNSIKNVFGFSGVTDYRQYQISGTHEVIREESAIIDVVDKVSPAVVSIVVKTISFDFFSGPTMEESGIGTGFIVNPNGLIVTNSHVVEDPSGEYSVVLKDGTVYEVDKIHLDQISDLAILEITARDLPVVEFGDSDEIKVGQTAVAIGNALGRFQNTVTVGVVSGVARQLRAYGSFRESKVYEGAIQTDAAINPGNSGGPLLNVAGQVIGINVATSAGADNISFAIPINKLKPILSMFLDKGKLVRPFLGVSYTMVSKEIAALRRMPEGAFISRVVPGTPADKAGLRRGDIIVSIDGDKLSSENSLSTVISEKKVDDTISLEVDREGSMLKLTAKLEEMPE